jgi:hypothetical protein
LACLRFHQRGKLEQLGIEIGSFDWKSANFGSSPIPSFPEINQKLSSNLPRSKLVEQ